MRRDNFFWISYSDLMTSLFFIMMVLFVVTIGYLQYQKSATEKQLEKITELNAAVKQLPAEYFEYQPLYKRFRLKEQIQFPRVSQRSLTGTGNTWSTWASRYSGWFTR